MARDRGRRVGDTTPLREAGKTVLRLAELIRRRTPDRGRRSMRTRGRNVLHQRYYRQSCSALWLISFELSCTRWRPAPQTVSSRVRDKVPLIVPMFHANGATVCGLDGGCAPWR